MNTPRFARDRTAARTRAAAMPGSWQLRWLSLACLLLAATLLALPVFAQSNQAGSLVQMPVVPAIQARVTDLAGMLQPEQRAALEQTLAEQERRRGSQIALLLVKSTAPEPLDAYSIRVADAWKLGRKGVDDGVLLIVAKDNPRELRRMRLEVGRGVQGVLTDAQSKRILQDTIAPHFQKNDYFSGLMAGVTAIDQVLNRENLPPVSAKARAHGPAADQATPGSVLGWLVGLLVFGWLLGKLLGGKSRRAYGRAYHNSMANDLSGVILGAAISSLGRGNSGGFGDGDSFSGGGGSFDGGGASGDW